MDLVDEQHFVGLQVHQQTDDVAGAFQGGSTGDAATHPQLLGQHQGHGGLAQTGRAVEKHMIKGFAAAPGRGDGDAQHLLEFALTDVIRQPPWPQTVFPTWGFSLASGRIKQLRPWGRSRLGPITTGQGRGAGRHDRHSPEGNGCGPPPGPKAQLFSED